MAFIDTQDTLFTMTNDKKTHSLARTMCSAKKKRQCERKQRNKKGTMKRNLLNKVLCISHKVGISFFFYHSKIDAIYQIPHCVCEFVMRIAIERYAYEKEKRQYCSYSGHFFFNTDHQYMWIESCQSKRKFEHCTNHDVPTQCNMRYISMFWLIRLYRAHHCIPTTNK